MIFVSSFICLLLGCLLTWLYLRSQYESETGKLEERNILISKNYEDAVKQLEQERRQSRTAENELARLSADYENLQVRLSEHKQEVERHRTAVEQRPKRAEGEVLRQTENGIGVIQNDQETGGGSASLQRVEHRGPGQTASTASRRV